MNRRQLFKFLGLGAAMVPIAPKLFSQFNLRRDGAQGRKTLDMSFYRMSYHPSSDIHDVRYFSVGVVKGKTYRPMIEHLNVGDYCDLTESEANEEISKKFGAGRYRRMA